MRNIQHLPFIILILFSTAAKAQHDFSAKTWFYIDSSIARKNNLSDLKENVQQLYNKAMSEKEYWHAAHCLVYQMQIADLKTEDSLYFKNSAFIDDMLQRQQPKQMQYALHLVLANRLSDFITKYKRFQLNRYERKDIAINYAAKTTIELDSIAQTHFEQAKLLAKEISLQNIEAALWLSADALQFLYKPDLFDIAIAEQLNTVKAKFYYQFKPAKEFEQWLPLSPDAFIAKLDTVNKHPGKNYKDLQLYQEWLQYHRQNPANYYFIESLLRKYVYDNIQSQRKGAEKVYENYLLQQTQSVYTTVKAYSVYQLCILWNSQANKYFPGFNFNYSYANEETNTGYDTTVRYHAVKALQLFNSNKNLLDSFTYLKNILIRMELKIKSTDILLSVPENNIPHKPILAELKFKNTDTLFYTIVQTRYQYGYGSMKLNDFIRRLLQNPVQKQGAFALPATGDHNYHNIFLNMEKMDPGKYAIVFSNKPLTDSSVKRQYVFFRVTNIALVNNDKRIYILNRTTGQPLQGAVVQSSYTEKIKKDTVTIIKEHEKTWTVNRQGFIEINNDNYKSLTIQYGNDTIPEYASYNEYETPEDVYTKEEFDDLVEFYEDNATAYIYTDRSIYRPGQTVFYKAIFITKNKNTGQPMLMNRKNLKGKLFSNVYKRFLKEEEPELEISDPFGKIMDSLKIVPNAFGSVHGSFKIPKTAATGEWNIEPDYIEVKDNNGSFRVEEYKRPSYEINIKKPEKEIKPGDDFVAAVKVRSFAGATLSNVRISYEVKAYANYTEYDSVTQSRVNRSDNYTYIDTTGYTNSNGELQIIVHDTAILNKLRIAENDWRVSYDISAEATDATGESYTKNISININSRPITIRIPLAAKYNRSEMPAVAVTASDNNAGAVDKPVNIKIYRVISNKKPFSDRDLTSADTWLMDKNELQNIFPEYDLLNKKNTITEELVMEKIVNTASKEKFVMDTAVFTAGNYKMVARCVEGNTIKGESIRNFSVFDIQTRQLPEPGLSYTYLPFTSGAPGDKMKYYYGNSESSVYAVFHVAYQSAAKTNFFYEEQQVEKGIQQYNFNVPRNATGQLKLTSFYIYNNQLFTNTQTIYVAEPVATEPEIIIEKYRKKLQPGSTETFSVSIKTNNENTAAELMTTMYDASLDKLQGNDKHIWRKPDDHQRRPYVRLDWTRTINSIVKNIDEFYFYNEQKNKPVWVNGKTTPLWWLNPLDYAYDNIISNGAGRTSGEYNFQHDMNPDIRYNGFNTSNELFVYGERLGGDPGASNMLQGRVAGLSLAKTQGLNEVVVTGYGTSTRRDITGSVTNIRIRGISSLASASQPLIILDGVVFSGDLSKIDPDTITAAMVLKGADAVAVYGSNAANGVLILSTKGDIVLPKEPEPQIVPRKNFNETAFFFPAVYADSEGFYSFSFTMPESVTEWNWKLLAHTKTAAFAYAERKLTTQLPLMVQPNMPRLLYQGDKIVLQSRITNVDTTGATGKIVCKVEDAVTGNDITSQFVTAAQNNFTAAAKTNTAAAFTLTVPAAQLNPVKISITVRTKNFADGEEHIIPILSPRVFVREHTPFYFSQQKDTSITLPALPADAGVFGLGLSVQPKSQAALLNSLPALANYPYGCAEQTFNKLLAYTTAYKLMRNDTAMQRSFTAAQQFSENEGKEKLPDELANETMPWLDLSGKTAAQQQQLFNVLDTAATGNKIDILVNRLQKLQQPDGGISWFDGGSSNVYMSNYILKGLGKLAADKQLLPGFVFDVVGYQTFLDKLVNFCDADFIKHMIHKEKYNGLYYAYCRSYQLQNFPLPDSMLQKVKTSLLEVWKNNNISNGSLYNQALLIITSLQYANSENDILYKNALAQLEKIKQEAIVDEQNGLRWKQLADDDDLTNTAEETIALLAEAFALHQKNNAVNNGIIKWLLTSKNEHGWSNTKATAAAINLLANENKTVSGETQSIQLTVGKTTLAASNDLLKGIAFDYAATTNIPLAIPLQNLGNTVASGNLYRYYFTAPENAARLNTDVQVSKQWFKWNSNKNAWELLLPNSTVKISDKIKVVLTVQNSKPLKYVFINDSRGAAFEPMDNSSGYEYHDGLEYYQSVRDAGHQFFIEFIPPGKHSIEYEIKVAQEGSFSNGIATLQCMYRPDITAYSNGLKIVSEQ